MRNGDGFDERFEIGSSFIAHSFLATTEHHLNFDFVTLGHEFFSLGFFEKEIMFLGTITKPNAFGLNFLLFGFGLLSLLGLVILKLAVITETTDRGNSLRRHCLLYTSRCV